MSEGRLLISFLSASSSSSSSINILMIIYYLFIENTHNTFVFTVIFGAVVTSSANGLLGTGFA